MIDRIRKWWEGLTSTQRTAIAIGVPVVGAAALWNTTGGRAASSTGSSSSGTASGTTSGLAGGSPQIGGAAGGGADQFGLYSDVQEQLAQIGAAQAAANAANESAVVGGLDQLAASQAQLQAQLQAQAAEQQRQLEAAAAALQQQQQQQPTSGSGGSSGSGVISTQTFLASCGAYLTEQDKTNIRNHYGSQIPVSAANGIASRSGCPQRY